MLRIIDRYILREVLAAFSLGLLVLTFLLLIPPIMQEAEKLIAKGIDSVTVARLMVTLLPQALGVTIPMALLIGLLMGLGRLSGDRETVAMQACGVSIYRMLLPVLLLALVAAVATAWVLLVALPDANQAFREITFRTVTSRAESEVRPRVFYEDFPNVVLYVREVPADGSGWSEVFLADTRKGDQPDVYVARRGRLSVDRERRVVDIVLFDGSGHFFDREDGSYRVSSFKEMVIGLDPETVFPRGSLARGYPELTIGQLQDEAERLRRQGQSPHQAIMAMHRKFSIPVACLVFAVIGLALGVTSRKDGKLASFVLGVAVIFAYYVIMYMSEAMAKAALVSPHLALWLPNMILGGAGVVLLLWRSRSVERRVALLPSRWRSARRPRLSRGARRRAPAERSGAAAAPGLFGLKLSILDWYVARLYAGVASVAFVGLLGVFYISTFIDLSDKLFKGQTSGGMLLRYFWYATPQFTYYVLPIAALLATLVTVGLLTKSSELTVMKACGISLYRSALPLLLFGLVWSALLFGLGESILARANREAEAIRHTIRGLSPQTFDVLNRKWIVAKDGSMYHYVYLDPRTNDISGLTVYEFAGRPWTLVRRSYAERVAFDGAWRAEHGWVREFAETPGIETRIDYAPLETATIPLEPPDYFKTEHPDAERMTYRQLEGYIRDLRASGFDVVQLVVALHRKLSFPFVTVILTLIAVPFAVTTGRRGALYGVGIGIVLAISYWIVISVFAAIGSAGLVSAPLAAWAPNIIFGGSALYLLLTVRT